MSFKVGQYYPKAAPGHENQSHSESTNPHQNQAGAKVD